MTPFLASLPGNDAQLRYFSETLWPRFGAFLPLSLKLIARVHPAQKLDDGSDAALNLR